MSFDDKLKQGRVAEGLIAQWLMARGNSVMPVYEIEKSHGKGPQLFSATGEHVAPDMLTFTRDGLQWIEAKHKSVFTWYRSKQQCWTTGIDLRHYFDYLHVWKQTTLPVWLMFFHRESRPSKLDLKHGCPPECPTGLFGGQLDRLFVEEHHRTPALDPFRDGCVGHGSSGMVYWAHSSLRLLATREQVLAISGGLDISVREPARLLKPQERQPPQADPWLNAYEAASARMPTIQSSLDEGWPT